MSASSRRQASIARALRVFPACLVAVGLLLALASPVAAQTEPRTLDVPEDYPTIEAAIEAARPGDVILLAQGTYPGGVVVPEDRPGITIRGVDRVAVSFDGEYQRANAIEVEADGVALENMTAFGYTENGFYWDGVDGFAGRYLTVWNVGLYGIYAIESRDGIIERSYVSGAADAAFYIGECNPCDTVIRDVTATLSAVGYSGTNAGGNLLVENSVFDRNGVGILPNSFDVGLEPPPQRGATFRGNVVTGTGSVPTPRNTPLGGYAGIGIGIAGGSDNVVELNEVIGSARYGIAVVPTIDFGTTWVPSGNTVSSNSVSGSGTADLALSAGGGTGNCFEDNTVGTAEPAGLAGCPAAGAGSLAVAGELERTPPELAEGLPPAPSYRDMPAAPAEPSMPPPLPPPPTIETAAIIGIVALFATIGGIAMVYEARPKNILDPKDRGNIPLRNAGVSVLVIGTSGLILAVLLAVSSGREPTTPAAAGSSAAAAPVAALARAPDA